MKHYTRLFAITLIYILVQAVSACGAGPAPFYRCPGELRPKASFVEACVASAATARYVGDDTVVKMICLSSAAQHGYCEAVP